MGPRLLVIAACLAAISARSAKADDVKFANEFLDPVYRKLMGEDQILTSCGVTRVGIPIRAIVDRELLNRSSSRCRILLVAGFSADDSVADTLAAVHWFHTSPEAAKFRETFAVGAVPGVNSEALVYPQIDMNTSGGTPAIGYPPPEVAYGDKKTPESIYVWRWIGMLAPDLVVEIRPGRKTIWQIDPKLSSGIDFEFAANLTPLTKGTSNRITAALIKNAPSGVAPIPAIEVSVAKGTNPLPELLRVLSETEKPLRSPARKELLRRQARTPVQVAGELAKVYGHNLKSVAYIPALALIGRCRLGELTGDASHLADVEKIVAPYFSGDKPTMDDRAGGSGLSGHLVFGELAGRTDKDRYIELAKVAADFGFDENGGMKESMPFHSEMSDAVFMGTPILVQTGRLTGQPKYIDMAARHLDFMLKLNLREDGLHQHSPLDPEHTAWGRGNGFPALGLALCLSDLPGDSPHFEKFLDVYLNHMAAMKKHQDEMGMWHQVVDHPESYREFTVTCMTTFAMARGLRNEWLDRATYEPVLVKAWQAIKTRIGNDGHLVDVCTGTGKQKSFREYLDRTAILGRDDRGGAMALMVATEIAFAEREKVLLLSR